MRKYETIVVFNPSFSESQAKEEVEKVKGIIEQNGGQDLFVDFWGKRDLSFEVKKNTQGWYACIYYDCENYQIVDKLNELLRISEAICLFQTHKINERMRKFKGRVMHEDSSGDGVLEFA